MQKDLSTSDFETIVTARVCAVLLRNNATKAYDEELPIHAMAFKFAVASNGVLRDFELQNDLEAISRGRRTYIIFRPTGRIACKVDIDGIYKDGNIRRPKAVLTSRRGFVRAKTMRALAEWTAKLGETKYSKGEKNGNYHQS